MRNFVLLTVAALSSASLRADFSYSQTTQMTGGAMLTMMRGLGPLARGARDPIVTTHLLKGNRMATIAKDNITITDLDKESITTIDTAKKQYSVVTFAEMKQAMENMMAKAESSKSKDGANMNFKVSAKATGQTKTVNGISAKEMVMTMTTETTDPKSGQTGAMDITTDMWMGEVAGYEQVKAFYVKMGQKMGYLFGSGMAQMGAMQPQTLKGFAQVAEEMAKVEGVPVEQVMKMGGNMAGMEGAQAPPANSQQQAKAPSASEAMAGALAGRLGGLGGFGRSKNTKQAAPKEEAPAAVAEAAPASTGSLMEMTTTLTSFSSGAVDASKFDVPAGFKQVENDFVKRSK